MADEKKEPRWDPAQTGALHDLHAGRWQLEADVAEMTLDVLTEGTYLPQFSASEHTDDYAYRRDMSVPLDMCRDGVRIRVDNIWRTAPKREVGGKYREIIETLIADADGEGTPLDEFMRRAAWQYYVSGIDIVPQISAAPEGVEIKTLADQVAQGIRPYFLQFTPLQRLDWAVGGQREFLWARYALGQLPREDEQAGQENTKKFLTVTRDEWRVHTAFYTDNGELERVETETVGHQMRGRVPRLQLYFAESTKDGQAGVPLSLLTRPAVIAKVAMNVKSQADADLLAAVTRWFATGIGSDDLPPAYGPGQLIKLSSPEAKVAVLQGDVGHIAEKRAWLLLYLGEILRLLKFRGGMAEIEAHSGSGLKLAIERTDLDNELRASAAQLETTEVEMMRQAVVLSTGTDIPAHDAAEQLGYEVHYNRDFVLEPLSEMLDNVAKWYEKCATAADTVPELGKEMLRQVGAMLAREGSPPYEQIMAEIDAAQMEAGLEQASKEPEPPVPPQAE